MSKPGPFYNSRNHMLIGICNKFDKMRASIMNKDLKKIYADHPWLKRTTTLEDYVEPDYYNKILKEYASGGITDLEFFKNFLTKHKDKTNLKILELGFGTGRATNILLNTLKKGTEQVTLVDLSPAMVEWTSKKMTKNNIRIIKSDNTRYLDETADVFDIMYSLWSYSHSIHQILEKIGIIKGSLLIKRVWTKFIKENMKKDSSFFIIHFDSCSEEQSILMKQYKRDFPLYKNTTKQSPSKELTDNILDELQNSGQIEYSCKHYSGDAIEYKSKEEALEVFMNFHMESYYNEHRELQNVIQDLENYFKKFQKSDGIVSIKPGFFIYSGKVK